MCEDPMCRLRPGVILSRSRQGAINTHTLPFLSPDFDRWATGSSLLTGHHKMKATKGGGGMGLKEGSSVKSYDNVQ